MGGTLEKALQLIFLLYCANDVNKAINHKESERISNDIIHKSSILKNTMCIEYLLKK